MRTTDFAERNVPLQGEWKLYWNRLVKPGDSGDEFDYVTFPRLWTKTLWKKQPLPAQGYGTYVLDILLPDSALPLALGIPEVFSSYRMFANGKLLAENGTPGNSPLTSIPYWSQQVVPLPSGLDSLRLMLQVSNFQHAKGGPNKDIVLGPMGSLLSAQQSETAFDLFLAGCLFMGGMFFIGLFVFGRHDQTLLYFSLFSFLYSYRIVGTKQYALHTLFPELPWSFTLHCEYLALYLSIGVFVLYTRKLYPEDTHPKIINSFFWVCMAFAAATCVLPTTLFTQLVTPFLAIMVLGIPYTVLVYWRALLHQRPGARYALMSTGALMLIFASILLEYYGMLAPGKLFLFMGYLGFFFLQSLVLSYRFASALKKAKEAAEMGLRAKSEFLSTMSHEIRTPLNSVIGMTHLLMNDAPRPDQKQHLDALSFSANNLLTIVNDILDFNKIEAGMITFSPGPIDLHTICRSIISGYGKLASDSGIVLRCAIDPALTTWVVADHTRMSQVISNLVQNAIKFTSEGTVTLRLTVNHQSEEDITITFAVEDTGIGIPEEKQKEIFERFTQVDSSATRGFGGTGLGLAICKRILELQQRRIETDQRIWGRVRLFTLPKPSLWRPAKKLSSPVVTEESKLEKPLEGVFILIVEDNKMNIMVAENFLKRWGASSEVASNGKEALEKIDPNRHDLILMDLHMPIMDGYEAIRLHA